MNRSNINVLKLFEKMEKIINIGNGINKEEL